MTADKPDCLALEIHFVGDYTDAPVQLPAVTPERLERLIDYLLRDRVPVRLGQVADYLDGIADLPPHTFYLTFDDGIRDHATHVLDILSRRGIEGAFFVPGSVFSAEGSLPLLERQRFLQYAFGSYPEFVDRFVAAAASVVGRDGQDLAPEPANLARMGDYLAEFSFYTPLERYYRFVRDKILSSDDFAAVIDTMFEARFPDERALLETYYLSPADLKRIADAGMVIGAHGYSHEHLPRLPDQRADITRGLDVLERITGQRPWAMAYPYGTRDATTLGLMDEMGFRLAFISENRLAYPAPDDRWLLPRIDVADALTANGL